MRLEILDSLIERFKLLELEDSIMFSDVVKIHVTIPSVYPTCEILNNTTTVEVDGIDWDNRRVGYTCIVSDIIESEYTQNKADRKIDRLANIETVLLNELEKIPQTQYVEGRVIRVNVDNVRHDFESSNTGLRLYLIIDFSVDCSIEVKQLS